jgi:hypothetical protein
VADDHQRESFEYRHLDQRGRLACAKSFSQFARFRQRGPLHFSQARLDHEGWQDEVGSEIVCLALRIQRIIFEVADVVLSAKEHATAVMEPMT